jgi:predicted alpha/beta hydrolase
MDSEPIFIPTADGGRIAALLYAAQSPRATVLLHPATAVTQGYYEQFARWLAGMGMHVLTYDYRGTGASRSSGNMRGSLRHCKVTMSGWMDEDVGAVTRWAAERFPGLPLLGVGHSVGGHAIALSDESTRLRAAVLVASHAGASRLIRGTRERLRVRFVMRVLGPLLCSLFGYMPGRRIGLGEDLPASVMRQWSRWTSLPRYFFDDPWMEAEARMARRHLPLLVLGFDDDPWANPEAIGMLVAPLANAAVERRQVAPQDAGVPAIGHMGFFRKRCAAVLWPQVGDWLLAHTAGHDAPAATEMRT